MKMGIYTHVMKIHRIRSFVHECVPDDSVTDIGKRKGGA